ncbi:MAG: hypothetical protein QW437_04560 [Fervidicoccaceae archaeon]
MELAEIELEIISVLVIGALFAAIYVLTSKSPLFNVEKGGRKSQPYTAGISLNGEHFVHVSDMIIFLSILLAVESLLVATFFVEISPWIILLFAASLFATVLGYFVYLGERDIGKK